jgi:hypothetical protein
MSTYEKKRYSNMMRSGMWDRLSMRIVRRAIKDRMVRRRVGAQHEQ